MILTVNNWSIQLVLYNPHFINKSSACHFGKIKLTFHKYVIYGNITVLLHIFCNLQCAISSVPYVMTYTVIFVVFKLEILKKDYM